MTPKQNIIAQLEKYRTEHPEVLVRREHEEDYVPSGDDMSFGYPPLTRAEAWRYATYVENAAAEIQTLKQFYSKRFMVSRLYLYGPTQQRDERVEEVNLALSIFCLYKNIAHLESEGERYWNTCRTAMAELRKHVTSQVKFASVTELSDIGCDYLLLYAHPMYGGGTSLEIPVFEEKNL